MALDGDDLVWYVSYGSNVSSARLGYYLAGGTLPGSTRHHTGCRDPRPPRAARPVDLPGGVYFALRSHAWGGGGLALYDPDLPGTAPARAYQVTVGQFSDIAAQEMGRPTGTDLDLGPLSRSGRVTLGPGCYETLIHPGFLDALPMVTFTAGWSLAEAVPTAPSAAYLTVIGHGLLEAYPWSVERAAEYLAGLPGAAGAWAPDAVAALLADGGLPVARSGTT